ncbi:MAG TPA: hypothetical protein VGU72_01020 [Beijerinckiaceae bacterium]|jgi:hypothetical protein|nr:hypothetical protein [Beijerinckiaceae bacterium]
MTAPIDRPARDLAANLIRRFRDGEISNDQFEDQWPNGSEDPALSALKGMIRQFYDDRYEHTLTWRHALKPEGHEAFSRFALFADNDLPYQWPPHDFIGAGGLGCFVITVGILAALIAFFKFGWMAAVPVVILLLWLDWRIHARNDRAQRTLEAAGDFTVWPFIQTKDYEIAQKSKRPETINDQLRP